MLSTEIMGHYMAPTGRIALVASRFNDAIVDRLIQGALQVLQQHNVSSDTIDIVRVPGAFEIPLISQKLAKTGRYQGIIALGALIKGATLHFEVISSACASGLMQASLASNLPILFGVLTCDTTEQALERAGIKSGNKGAECAMALLEMINLADKIDA